jgi:hypothetical protein
MPDLGLHIQLMLGPTVPVPAPASLLEMIESIQVQRAEDGRSGLQMVFTAARSPGVGTADFDLLLLPQLLPYSRLVLSVLVGAIPTVIFDGVLTHRQMQPSAEPGGSRLTISAEDVSTMMDLEEKIVEHPAQPDNVIATVIVASYAQYGLIPMVLPPVSLDPPLPIERTPVQNATDLRYLRTLAERHGYVFYVKPGPAPLANIAYWGPPERIGLPQRALAYNVGADSNVDNISFQHDPTTPTLVSGRILDRQLNQEVPIETFASVRPPLALMNPLVTQLPNVRRETLRDAGGTNTVQAMGRAQGRTDRSMDRVVVANGTLDVASYGGVLQPQALVGLRGVGATYGGVYYVRQVTHDLRIGSYKQSFVLQREGAGTTVPAVIP